MPADFNGHDGGNKTIFFSKGTRRVENGVALCPEFADPHFFACHPTTSSKKRRGVKTAFLLAYLSIMAIFSTMRFRCAFF